MKLNQFLSVESSLKNELLVKLVSLVNILVAMSIRKYMKAEGCCPRHHCKFYILCVCPTGPGVRTAEQRRECLQPGSNHL